MKKCKHNIKKVIGTDKHGKWWNCPDCKTTGIFLKPEIKRRANMKIKRRALSSVNTRQEDSKMSNTRIKLKSIPLMIILTGCASKFDRYKQTTNYNAMTCQKMCSTGDVAQIENFGCACNFNARRNPNQNRNMNYSASHGNVVNLYGISPNSAQNQNYMPVLNNLMNYENQRLNRMSQDLNGGGDIRINNYNNNNNVPQQNMRVPSNFGGFGGFN